MAKKKQLFCNDASFRAKILSLLCAIKRTEYEPAITAKSAFGTVRRTRTSPSDGHPTDHEPLIAPIFDRGEPNNTFSYLPIYGSKRPVEYKSGSDRTKGSQS